MKKKIYKVMASTCYQGKLREYVVGTFTSKREANKCLARQYTTVSRTFDIVEEFVNQ